MGPKARAAALCIALAAAACGIGAAVAFGDADGASPQTAGDAVTLPATSREDPVVAAPTEGDVAGAMGSLSFHGRDVSVDASACEVTLEGTSVLVTEASDSDAVTRVDLAARRAAALAHALGDTGASEVTWAVRTTAEGSTPDVAVTDECGSAAAGMAGESEGDDPTTAEVVSRSTGWSISVPTHEALGDIAGEIPASGGRAPARADGTAIVPDAAPNAAEGDSAGPDGAEAADVTDSESGSGEARAALPAAAPSDGLQSGPGSSQKTSGGSRPDSEVSGQSQAPAHQHAWATRTVTDSAAWDETVLAREEWDEPVADGEQIVFSDGHVCYSNSDALAYERQQALAGKRVSYSVKTKYRYVHHDATYRTVHHDAVTHQETYCTSCGATR